MSSLSEGKLITVLTVLITKLYEKVPLIKTKTQNDKRSKNAFHFFLFQFPCQLASE